MTPERGAEVAGEVERDLWWGYMCPALANIGVLKQAQSDLIALGADWAEAGTILSRVQSFYVNAAHGAAQRYLTDAADEARGDMERLERTWRAEGAAEALDDVERELAPHGPPCADCYPARRSIERIRAARATALHAETAEGQT